MSEIEIAQADPLRAYWRGDRSLQCRAAYAKYCRQGYRMKAEGKSNLVSINRARQLLLTFESSHDAARVLQMDQATIYRILSRRVKRIRVETERRILMADRKQNVIARGKVA